MIVMDQTQNDLYFVELIIRLVILISNEYI